ncbi:MAG TPA: helix-turn-helix domain-containing protein [Microlunatus sp.]|nr:helix-turn-helix domain-containing protein [Microlunatus sp.]
MPKPSRVRPEIVDDQGLPVRQLQRPEQLRALAHPRRMQILDLLIAEGPLTASQCAALLDDSAASCSYHLRQLARFGFVEEAEGGQGRNRPWRWVPVGNHFETAGSPAERSAAEALGAVIDARNVDRIRRYAERRSADPWRASAQSSDWAIRMTEEELAELGSAIAALLVPLQRRTFAGEAPAGSRLVDVLTYLMPRPDERTDQPDA